MADKSVRLELPMEDFITLVQYTQQLPDGSAPELMKLKDVLWRKLDKMVEHELYTKFKTAPTEEAREKARQEYLERRGILTSFRW